MLRLGVAVGDDEGLLSAAAAAAAERASLLSLDGGAPLAGGGDVGTGLAASWSASGRQTVGVIAEEGGGSGAAGMQVRAQGAR